MDEIFCKLKTNFKGSQYVIKNWNKCLGGI